jgi:MFS family permease
MPLTPSRAYQPGSPWRVLGRPVFRSLWIGSVVANLATWMRDVAGAWLMTSLSPVPIMVALIQTATTLPFFLIGLPVGALADVLDRRRMLLVAQIWTLACATALGILTLAHLTTPAILLALTFALGLGAAMTLPVWQATMQELVPRDEMPAAVTVAVIGPNLARAVGPALGGLIVALAGSGVLYLLTAAATLGVIGTLYRWRRMPVAHGLPPEHLFEALRAGLRYVRHAPVLHHVLMRTIVFVLCGSALWALLPVVARQEAGLDAVGYGVLLGCLGAGAVIGGSIVAPLRERVSVEPVFAMATVVFAMATTGLATVRQPVLLSAVMLVGGIAWMGVMSTLIVAAQIAMPGWVRARALSAYMLTFQGAMAAGSVLWGWVATTSGIPVALLLAGGGLVVGLGAARRYRLTTALTVDLKPSAHWPEPQVVVEPRPDQGPVLVTVEYRIDPERAVAFAQAMADVERTRRRDGAIQWGLFVDSADECRYVEVFLAASWIEHLRQHARATVADREVDRRAQAFHIADTPPVISHFIGAQRRSP